MASDELNKIKHGPALVIFNTDASYLKGSHWLAMYVERPQILKSNIPLNIHIFDPLGKSLAYYNIALPSRFKIVNQNGLSFQGSVSNSSGLFCLFYLAKRVLGLNHRSSITKFSRVSKRRNGIIVNRFYKSLSFCVVKCKSRSCCQVSRF